MQTRYYGYIVLFNGTMQVQYLGNYPDDAYNRYIDWMTTFAQHQLKHCQCRGYGLGAELIDVIARTQVMVEQAG